MAAPDATRAEAVLAEIDRVDAKSFEVPQGANRKRVWRIPILAASIAALAVVGLSHGARASSDPALPLESSIPTEPLASDVAGPQPRIVGGQPTSIVDYPYLVYLTDQDRNRRCGGTLIRGRWVLTAAHCVEGLENDEAVVYLGYGESRPQVVSSARIEVHPDYRIEYDNGRLVSVRNDVALVRLAERAATGRRSISTTGLSRSPTLPLVGSQQTIVGWGLTAIDGELPTQLQQASVTIKRCSGSLLDEDQAGHVCASGPTTTGCFGDSGGPLLRGDRVVGVFSYVSLDCSPAPKYGVYTRISSVVNWIDETVMVRCNGLAPTVRLGRGEGGTDGPDVILGTPGNDVILGFEGDDIICGLGGDDVILGGPGNDVMYGNTGDDDLGGDSGDDVLRGNRGNDRLNGGSGVDQCRGGFGSDTQVLCE